MNLAAYTGVEKGLFEILSDSSGRNPSAILSADQDEDAMESMDVQAQEPGQCTVDDGASVLTHI